MASSIRGRSAARKQREIDWLAVHNSRPELHAALAAAREEYNRSSSYTSKRLTGRTAARSSAAEGSGGEASGGQKEPAKVKRKGGRKRTRATSDVADSSFS